MIIDNCCFFYGTMLIEDSKGVNITAGIIGCDIKITGKGINRIAGNYMIAPDGAAHELSEDTIVQNNFSTTGFWDKNR